MSAPATNDLSPAPVTMTTRMSASYFSSRIARRSSSSVSELSALSTFGRLIVRTADAPSRSRRRLTKAMTSERERINQPAENDRRSEKPAEHHAAEPHLIAQVVFGDHREDQRHEKREHDEQQHVALHHLRP